MKLWRLELSLHEYDRLLLIRGRDRSFPVQLLLAGWCFAAAQCG